MAEENEAAKKDATELEESKLAEADGGFGIGDLGTGTIKRIHRGCGGTITDDLVGRLLLMHTYICSKCGERHEKVEEFDHYLEGFESPMF